MEPYLVPALVCAVIGLADGACVPWLISLVPEPEQATEEPVAELVEATDGVATSSTDDDPEEPKVPYAEVAASPGLAWKAALATGLANGLLGAWFGWDWRLLYLVPLTPVLVALAVIDWRTRLLPLRIVWPATFVTACLVVVVWLLGGEGTADLTRAGAGFLVGFGSLFVLWFVHPSGLGFGDVRLGGLLGLALGYLGWGELVVGLYSGFLLGGLGGGLLALLRVVERRAFPFGPFLVGGALVGILVGDPVLRYLVGR